MKSFYMSVFLWIYVKKVQFKVYENACIKYGEVVFYLKEIEQN